MLSTRCNAMFHKNPIGFAGRLGCTLHLFGAGAAGITARALGTVSAPDPVVLTALNTHNGVFTITLNRPNKRNALSQKLISELRWNMENLPDRARCVVLAGAGPAFSSGHDLKELRASQGKKKEERDAELARLFQDCGALMKSVRDSPVPVIAAVHGAAHAAGCELIASCDLVVADELQSSFATPGVKIGLFCHTPAVAVVKALGGGRSGVRRAAKMLYTGIPINAHEALEMGLVHEIAPEGSALAAAASLAEQISSASPVVIRHGKGVLRTSCQAEGVTPEEAHRIAAAGMVEGLSFMDANEGIGAFLEKRPPSWAPTQGPVLAAAKSLKVWAVIGDVLNSGKPANHVAQRLRESGRKVVLINPRDSTGECFKSLSEACASIDEKIDCVNICISPKAGVDFVKETAELGIEYLFMQPGADAPAVIDAAKTLRLAYERGCVLVQDIPDL